MSASDEKDEKRLTIRLSDKAKEAVEELARLRGATINSAIRHAIGTELFLLKEQINGSKILIKDNEGTRQLLLL